MSLSSHLSIHQLGCDDFSLYDSIYSDGKVMRHIGRPKSEQVNRLAFRRLIGEATRSVPRFLVNRLSYKNQSAGLVGIDSIDLKDASANIGIMLLTSFQGRRLAATWLKQAMLMYHQQWGIGQFRAVIGGSNLAAIRLFETANFSHTHNRAHWQIWQRRCDPNTHVFQPSVSSL